MLDNLTQRLSKIIRKIKGEVRLTESNTSEMLREIRIALLEADVSFSLVRSFIDSIKKKCLGVEVIDSLNPGQVLVDLVYKELTNMIGGDLGEYSTEISLSTKPPAFILMIGLQGVGKTTTSGKLAYWFKNGNHRHEGRLTGKKRVLLVSLDIYRPAAIEQLNIIAQQINVDFFHTEKGSTQDIAYEAIDFSRKHFYDLVIFDTAGRLSIDKSMMKEVSSLYEIIAPIETLFVIDGMQGQDSINTAKIFSEAVPITGIILTKMDGDARGGAALSVRNVTGKPLKFVGVSEKIDGLENFYPDRMASRILGMGDIISLVESVKRNIDVNEAKNAINLIKIKNKFDFNDFRAQIIQMRKMGSIKDLLSKLPEGLNLPSNILRNDDHEKNMIKTIAIIDSMTILERKNPEILKSSRKRRISRGSGVSIQDINRLLKQFQEMQIMMKKAKKGGFTKIFNSLSGISNLFK